MAKEEWHFCIENHHDAYISIEDYQTNCSILASNNTRKNASATREGNALLQGIVICAACGKHMNNAYKKYKGDLIGIYQCVNTSNGTPFAHSRCIGSRTAG